MSNGSLRNYYAATFFKTKMNEILCRTPFTILPSIQSRFKSYLSKVKKFTFLLLVQVVFGLYTRYRFYPNIYWKVTLRQAMKLYLTRTFSTTYHSQNFSCATFFLTFHNTLLFHNFLVLSQTQRNEKKNLKTLQSSSSIQIVEKESSVWRKTEKIYNDNMFP